MFYNEHCSSEKDFYENDLFNNIHYNNKITFIFYNKNTTLDFFELFKMNKNIVFFGYGIKNFNYIEKILNPFVIFHLSDEKGCYQNFHNLYNHYLDKIIIHQYNHKHINYGKNHFQIHLGYFSEFLNSNYSINNSIYNPTYNLTKRPYEFSFIGV